MKKNLVLVGSIILGFLLILALLFVALYTRYKTQTVEIHNTVNSFISDLQTGKISSSTPYLYNDPIFLNQLIDITEKNKAFFSGINKVTEDSWYFDYSWKSEIGETTKETTTYNGKLFASNGVEEKIDIELIKSDGQWKVYGFHLVPK